MGRHFNRYILQEISDDRAVNRSVDAGSKGDHE